LFTKDDFEADNDDVDDDDDDVDEDDESEIDGVADKTETIRCSVMGASN
jgi:hypothetical protein